MEVAGRKTLPAGEVILWSLHGVACFSGIAIVLFGAAYAPPDIPIYDLPKWDLTWLYLEPGGWGTLTEQWKLGLPVILLIWTLISVACGFCASRLWRRALGSGSVLPGGRSRWIAVSAAALALIFYLGKDPGTFIVVLAFPISLVIATLLFLVTGRSSRSPLVKNEDPQSRILWIVTALYMLVWDAALLVSWIQSAALIVGDTESVIHGIPWPVVVATLFALAMSAIIGLCAIYEIVCYVLSRQVLPENQGVS